MPIYAYRCEHCGHQQDVLQKISDPLLVTCPSCGQPTFRKQVTAAGFQLKGSGWYVTDFRNPAGNGAKKPGGDDAPEAPKTDAAADKPATTDAGTPSASPAAAPAPAPAPAASGTTKSAPAPGGGSSG